MPDAPVAQRVRILREDWTADQIRNYPDSIIGSAVREVGGSGSSGAAYHRKALSVTPLPRLFYSRRRWQQSAYNQDNVTTLPDGTQYAVGLVEVSAGVRHWFIFKRTVGSPDWIEFDLASVSAGFNQVPRAGSNANDDDSHNTVSIAVDADGNIHAAGNMHSQPMRYVRTSTPGDITSFVARTVSATATDQVTYPMFFRTSTGKLFLAWRNGLATSGDFYVSQWNGAAWSAPQKLFDGTSTGQGAYLHRIAVRDGKVGIFYMFRGAGDASTNQGIYYVESVDDCATWQKWGGAAQSLPITPSNGDRVVNIAEAAGLINQGGADLDVDLAPHGAFQLYDSNGLTQLYHLHPTSPTVWALEKVTNWHRRIETVGQTTLDLQVARPHLFCTDEGRTYMLARTSGEGYYGRPLLIDVSPGSFHEPIVLLDMNLYGWEPAIDSRALRERGELNMLVTSIDHESDSETNWDAQWGGILSIHLPQIDKVQAGLARPGTIKPIHSFPAPADVTVPGGASASTEVDASLLLNSAFLNPSAAYGQGTKFFARVVGRVDFKSGTTSALVLLREKPSSGALPSSDLSKLVLANSTIQGYFETPWEPMPGTPFLETNGLIRGTNLVPIITADNIAGLRFRGFVIEIGVLELP